MSELKVNKVTPRSGTTVTLGDSGDTITIPSGATITNNGTATGFGGTNTPAFSASLGTTQNISTATLTKLNIDTEVFDTDSCYDNVTNYRFTPNVAGKYLFMAQTRIEGTGSNQNARILKNGSLLSFSIAANAASTQETTHNIVCVEMNGTTDYVELFAEQNSGGTKQVYGDSSNIGSTTFSGFRIIGA
jgi:hypothetical protein